jgi:hypothetical protein
VFGILKDNSEPALNSNSGSQQAQSPSVVNGRKSTSVLFGGRMRNNSVIGGGGMSSLRRDSDSTVGRVLNSMQVPANNDMPMGERPTTGDPNAALRGSGGGGGFFYRSRHARSMDALKLFTKSTLKAQSQLSPTSINSTGTAVVQTVQTVIVGVRPTSIEKDSETPVLSLEVEEDEDVDGRNGSRGSSLQDGLPLQRQVPLPGHVFPTAAVLQIRQEEGVGLPKSERVIDGLPESIRRSLDSKVPFTIEGTGIGGLPPKGARGAIATPVAGLTKITPEPVSESKPTPFNDTPSTNEPLITLHQRRSQSITTVSNDSHDSSNSSANTTTSRQRPPKPNLSIPIPPRQTNEHTPVITSRSNSTGVATATVDPNTSDLPPSPVQMKYSPPTSPSQSAHLRSATTPVSGYSFKGKAPPSPGLSLRLTPSIVMSRPIWPLPPLPNTDIPPVPSITTSKHSPSNNSPPNNSPSNDSSPSGMRQRLSGFSLTSHTRSVTGPPVPLRRATTDGNADRDEGSRIRRSMSVKLNAMPSLNVMGETETGDPEADDYEEDDEDDEDEDTDEDEGVVMSRPSIDSVLSMDSMASIDTVRPESSAPSEPPTASTSGGMAEEVVPSKDKGKGKARQRSKDDEVQEEGDQEDGSASDSDDSVYFDARGSVFLSPKDVAKALERRHSQIQSQPRSVPPSEGPTSRIRIDTQGPRDEEAEREKRNSGWSFSTNGRESIYLTPMESVSPFRTPGSSAILSHQTDLLRSNSAFAKELANKRSSVPAAFTAPFGAGANNSGISSRKEMRFSMSNAIQPVSDGLPGIDVSGLNFDPSIFKARTPSNGSTPRRASLRQASAGDKDGTEPVMPSVPDGLPPIRKDGLPNFDAALPITVVPPNEEDGMRTPTEREARAPRSGDYFNQARDSTYSTLSTSTVPSPVSRRESSSTMTGSLESAIMATSASVGLGLLPTLRDRNSMASSTSSTSASSVTPTTSPSHTIRIPSPSSLNQATSASSPATDFHRANLHHAASPSPVLLGTNGKLAAGLGDGARRARPPVYRQVSRSMVDLSTSSAMGIEDDDIHYEAGDYKGADHKHDPSLTATTTAITLTTTQVTSTGDSPAWLVPPPTPTITRPPARSSTIRRVSSVPLLQSTEMAQVSHSESLPPYDSISRREEEGKEDLPPYSNDIILAGLLPRKMEFDKPGVQARDRSWRKVWCVLHGTMFRIYKVGAFETKFGALSAAPVAGQLPATSASSVLSGGRIRSGTQTNGPSRLGPGNNSSSASRPGTAQSTATKDASGKTPIDANLGPTTLTKNASSAGLLAPPGPTSPTPSFASGNPRSSGSSYASPRSSFSSSRPSTPLRSGGAPGHGHSQSIASIASGKIKGRELMQDPGHGPDGGSLMDNGGTKLYNPAPSALLHQYTLQNAESGLATDYIKRRNVIRVRMEGEQFLLQMPTVEDVVDWIEVSNLIQLNLSAPSNRTLSQGFQAAANVAPDLDTRPMPRGPLYPRYALH